MASTDVPRVVRRQRSEQPGHAPAPYRSATDPSLEHALADLAGTDRAARAGALEFVFGTGVRPLQLTDEQDETVARVILRTTTDSGPLDPSELIGLIGNCRGTLRQQAVLYALGTSIGRRPIGDADLGFLLSTIGAMSSPPDGLEADPIKRLVDVIGRTRLVQAMDEPGVKRLGAIRLLSAELAKDEQSRPRAAVDDSRGG